MRKSFLVIAPFFLHAISAYKDNPFQKNDVIRANCSDEGSLRLFGPKNVLFLNTNYTANEEYMLTFNQPENEFECLGLQRGVNKYVSRQHRDLPSFSCTTESENLMKLFFENCPYYANMNCNLPPDRIEKLFQGAIGRRYMSCKKMVEEEPRVLTRRKPNIPSLMTGALLAILIFTLLCFREQFPVIFRNLPAF